MWIFLKPYKAKLYRGYIDLEIQLREFHRCRTLYEKFLLFDPENCAAWMKFAELESLLGDVERARGVYELAVSQPRLDMPEILWKAYIDFEIEQDEPDRARDLYAKLLTKTHHVKVWLSFAQFELSVPHEDRIAQVVTTLPTLMFMYMVLAAPALSTGLMGY